MNPAQIEAHCLSEIERFESMLELIRTQKDPPGEKVRSALGKVAYSCSLASEPLESSFVPTELKEVDDGSNVGKSR